MHCQNYEYVPDEIPVDRPYTPLDEVAQSVHVDHILEKIPDPLRRLAFRLHINGYPIEGRNSISKAVGKTPRTVSTWIRETEALLSAEIGESHD